MFKNKKSQDKERMEKENLRLRKLKEDYKVPSVLSYMEEKKDVVELRKLLRIWRRKVEVAQVTSDFVKFYGNMSC